MPANRNRNTYRAQAARTAAPCVDPIPMEELVAELEPMRRYPHPIPMCCAPDPVPIPTDECSPCMNRVLEQLSCQNQLLMDLLGAVNSLTAALLSGRGKN